MGRISFGIAVAAALGVFIVSPCKADDCSKDNALACYTQALVRLQAAQQDLASARADIQAQKAELDALKQAQKTELDALKAELGADLSALALECKNVEGPTSEQKDTNAFADYIITETDKDQGYVVTGGGCTVNGSDARVVNSNPIENGWHCAVSAFNGAGDLSARAGVWVRMCRIARSTE